MQSRKSNPVITIVRDPDRPLGKQFKINADGTVSKESTVSLSRGIAVQHRIETHAELADLLVKVGNDPHAAFINSGFIDASIGEAFLMVSSKEIEQRFGIPASDRERQKGIHETEYKGAPIKAVGRFKENVTPSNWQLVDRDIDKHTPPKYAELTTTQWLQTMASIIPGVDNVSYVEIPSTSSRVIQDGKAVGGGNAHVWVFVDDPADIERARTAMIVRAAQAEMTWHKPRYSKADASKVVGNSLTTILDPSVWTPGRFVFDGKPTVGEGLTVLQLVPVIHTGELNSLDTATMTMPDAKTVREFTRKAGIEMSLSADGRGYRFAANNLALATEIETKEHGILTVREMMERRLIGKLRCQAPFRASESFAAFYNLNADGIPFVHDSGTNTTHWLNETEAEEVKTIPASEVVRQNLPQVKEDSFVVLEDQMIDALATIKKHKPADYNRKRAELKQINSKVPLADMDRAVKARIAESDSAQTHHGYAKLVLAELVEKSCAPVGHHGLLYVLNPDTNLWEALTGDALIQMVANQHDGKENCTRRSDYRAVAEHAISLANDESFFADAANGLACPGGFYQIVDNGIHVGPLTSEHRQRVMLDFTPLEMATPYFDQFLHETFESPHEGEEEQQIQLLQEIAGGIMLGILHKSQIAILFYEPFGRAGKGTLEKQIRALVPKQFVSAISPFKWHQDYHVAALAGMRLNVVGELPENEPIPAAAFKSVIGADLVTGRHPTHRPITFTNEAAHLFTSNHLITTKDHSEAFFARWKIVEFPNSRLRSGLPLDKDLAQRIIDNELAGIAWWALKGAARLLANGKFSESSAHDRLMAKWRCKTNTLSEFIDECCVLSKDGSYKRSELYKEYVEWCSENSRKPFAKGRVKELLEHNIGMGIRLVELNGYETFRGLSAKPEKSDPPKIHSKSTSIIAQTDPDDDF
jgi:putative DNA primase/helicase